MSGFLKKGIFYGWVIVFGAWLVTFVTSGVNMTFSVFFPALMGDYGWTRSMLSIGFILHSVFAGVMEPVVGMLVDRLGPRKIVIIGGIIGGLGTALLSQVTQIWHFYVFYGIIATLGTSMAGYNPTLSTVRRWFMRKAGLVMGIALTGSGLGVVILSPVGSAMIERFSWQTSYIVFGIIMAVGCVVGGWVLIRTPESHGTFPDGIKPTPEELKTRADYTARYERWSLKETLKTRAFWLYTIAGIGYSIPLNGIISSIFMWGKDLGMTSEVASSLLSSFILAAVAGRVLGGILSDRMMSRFKGISRKPLLYCGIACTGIGCLLGATIVNQPVDLFCVSLICGFGIGFGFTLFPAFFGDQFGVINIPMLAGINGMFFAALAATGAALFNFSFDATNSYKLAMSVTAGCCVVSIIMFTMIKRPHKRSKLDPVSETIEEQQ
ncbi:MAG: MFS transporter [Chloroflexi bacterium]|nr:MFS transporter [Chloroflexota bacterium]